MKPTPQQIKEKNRELLSSLQTESRETRISLVQNHLSICQLMLNEIFEEECIEKSGERYNHKKPGKGNYSRWGYNPGSVQIGDQRLKVEVPRIREMETGKFEKLESYEKAKKVEAPSEQLIKGVLLGLSMRDYDSVIDHLGEGFGLSKSSVSRSFIDRTAEKLEEFENRDLSNHDFISVFIDGKYLAKQQIMIVLGVTMTGDKIPIGFLQTHSENSVPIKALFENLISRGFKYDQGILFIIDGAKGIKKAIEDVFKNKAVIQRCTWHKRENVKKYLKEEDQKWFESEYHSALERAKYVDARKDLIRLSKELEKINISAARSLNEALEEILTLHKLKMNDKIWRSFNTTNPIENLNSQLEKYLHKVKYWKNSSMRYRWIAAGLLEIEQKMNKIFNYKKIPLLRKALISYISNPSDLLS